MIRDDDLVPAVVEVFEDCEPDDVPPVPRLLCGCAAVHPLPIWPMRDGTEYCVVCAQKWKDTDAAMRRAAAVADIVESAQDDLRRLVEVAFDFQVGDPMSARRAVLTYLRIGRGGR